MTCLLWYTNVFTHVLAVRAMLLLDEIRGRLCEVFSLKTFKIDHVLHGAIASAIVYGALVGATASQIESAVGVVAAHYVRDPQVLCCEERSHTFV